MDVLKNVIKETFLKALTESVEEAQGDFQEIPMATPEEIHGGKMTALYRVFDKKQLNSIIKYGYDREFTSSKGGNMYGPGVYTTFNLKDTIYNVQTKPEYGDCIMKMYLNGGFDRFLIFNETKAKEQYGNKWKIEDQLNYLFPPSLAKKIYEKIIETKKNERCGLMHGRTAPCALAFWRNFGKTIYQYHVRGVIYTGNRDGDCAVPYDFSSVIPYSYSDDYGKTWKVIFNDNLYKRLNNNSIDTQFRFGDSFELLGKSFNGYQRIKDKYTKKYNIIKLSDNEMIFSNGGVDAITNIDPDTLLFEFDYNNQTYLGSLGNTNVLDDGQPFFGILDDTTYEPIMDFNFNNL